MNSYVAKASTIERKWFVVDAEGKTLGRLASEIAAVLRGKRKPTFTPFLDCGDYVIVEAGAEAVSYSLSLCWFHEGNFFERYESKQAGAGY